MESSESSLLTPSDAASAISASSTATTRSKSRTANVTWSHTRPAREGEPVFHSRNRILYCAHCPPESAYGHHVTTNFRRHVSSKHHIEIEENPSHLEATIAEKLQQLYIQAKASGETSGVEIQVLQEALNQDQINAALVSLIVTRNLPFRIMEWPEFHVFCRLLNPYSEDFLVTAHSTVPRLIDRSWQETKSLIREKIQSARSIIHISLDIWTSPNRLLLLGICGHFVDRQWHHRKTLLALRPVAGHSGQEQFQTFLPVLQEYGFSQKLGAIVSDNASTNDTLCRAIRGHLEKVENIVWDDSLWRLRCIGHIINLAVEAFLFQDLIEEDLGALDQEEAEGKMVEDSTRVKFRKIGPLGQLHNIVVHIRSSPSRTQEFKDLAKRTIPLDNRTRWNSWFKMLQVSDQTAGALDSYSKKYFESLQKDYLSPDDWKRLRSIQSFLEPFHRATLETQGDRASLDRVLFSMDILIRCFEDGLKEYRDDQEFSSRIQKGWEALDKYYSKTDDSALYAAALILHPGRRLAYLRTNWKPKWQKVILKKVTDLWKSYRDRFPASNDGKQPLERFDKYDQVAQTLTKYRPRSQDEFEDYSNAEPSEIGSLPALEWWCHDSQRERWPRLSCMAIDILSIPPMSAEPERVFSGARRTISWDRAQLSASVIETTECLKHALRSKIVENEDED